MKKLTNDEIMALPFDRLTSERIDKLTKKQAMHLWERLSIFVRRGGKMFTVQQRAFLYETLHELNERATS